jgi:hypothetical protein
MKHNQQQKKKKKIYPSAQPLSSFKVRHQSKTCFIDGSGSGVYKIMNFFFFFGKRIGFKRPISQNRYK